MSTELCCERSELPTLRVPPGVPKPLVRTPYFQKGFVDGEFSVLNQTGPTTVGKLKMPLVRRGGKGMEFLPQKDFEADFLT